MRSLADTIVAPITGLNRAAVAVVRVSGAEAWAVASRVFAPWPDPVEPRVAVYGRFVNGDDGLVLAFAEGASYTGEESVELSVHGSLASVRALVEACIAAGARLAEPGEFTYRAFMSGRIDLTQAEGVRDTVDAVTQGQLRLAGRLRDGDLRKDLEHVAETVLRVLAAVEAATDFEEETGPFDRVSAASLLASARVKLEAVLAGSSVSRIIREGIHVAIAGRPNVGKSSLLNRVLGSDRAIVTPIAGTTRDTVEATVEHAGLALVLVDTAGLHEAVDTVEALGIERSRDAVATADIAWYVFDGSQGWTKDDATESGALGRPWIKVANKADLVRSTEPGSVAVSALTGEGVPALLARTVETAGGNESEPGLLNVRHRPLVEGALEAVRLAGSTMEEGLPHDLAAVHLQSALRFVGEATGSSAGPDVLDRLFATFCIGK